MFTGFRGQRTYYRPNVNSDTDQSLHFYRYSANWVVFSWFTGFALIVYSAYQTFITIDAIFHLFVVCGAVATAAHYYSTQDRHPRMLPPMAFYNFAGVACLACALLLMANLTFPGDEQYQTVPISKVSQRQVGNGSVNASEVTLGHSEVQQFQYVINFEQWKLNEFRSAKAIRITYQPGLLGFKVYKGAELVHE